MSKQKKVQVSKSILWLESKAPNVVYWLRRVFWKDKYFVGTYWETNNQIKTWVANEPVLILRVIRENTIFVDFDQKNKEVIQVAKSVRVRNKQADKQRRVHVIYVEDNAFTRMIGYKETVEHKALGL